jgi:hypothetical protein
MFLHGVTTQKTNIDIFTVARTSNLIFYEILNNYVRNYFPTSWDTTLFEFISYQLHTDYLYSTIYMDFQPNH